MQWCHAASNKHRLCPQGREFPKSTKLMFCNKSLCFKTLRELTVALLGEKSLGIPSEARKHSEIGYINSITVCEYACVVVVIIMDIRSGVVENRSMGSVERAGHRGLRSDGSRPLRGRSRRPSGKRRKRRGGRPSTRLTRHTRRTSRTNIEFMQQAISRPTQRGRRLRREVPDL